MACANSSTRLRSRSTATSMPQPETRAGSFPTKSFTATSTTLSGRSTPSCTAAACTTSWSPIGPRAGTDPSAPTFIVEYARLWKPVLKVVFSSTLDTVEMELAACERRSCRRSHQAEGSTRQEHWRWRARSCLDLGVRSASSTSTASTMSRFFWVLARQPFHRFRTGSRSNRLRPEPSPPAPCSSRYLRHP